MLNIESTVMYFCDIQEGFRSSIYNFETVVSKSLSLKEASDILVMRIVDVNALF